MSDTPTSPKVTASTTGAAAAALLMYLLGLLPVVDAMPDAVKGALLVLVTAAVSYAAGWLKSDPLRRYSGEHSAA